MCNYIHQGYIHQGIRSEHIKWILPKIKLIVFNFIVQRAWRVFLIETEGGGEGEEGWSGSRVILSTPSLEQFEHSPEAMTSCICFLDNGPGCTSSTVAPRQNRHWDSLPCWVHGLCYLLLESPSNPDTSQLRKVPGEIPRDTGTPLAFLFPNITILPLSCRGVCAQRRSIHTPSYLESNI